MGPLVGLRFIEIGGIGPGPFCGMMLADMGADVIAVHRPGYARVPGPLSLQDRGKRCITLDFKDAHDVERLLKLCEHADGMFEGFRPGVMEKLGLGPEACLARNPRLVYGRISGYGQNGPLCNNAGHDLNYVAMSGVLDLIRAQDGQLTPPANLIADNGGGALQMAFGLLCGVISARATGNGQVIDVALSEGAASLATFFFGGDGFLRNFLCGAAPFYTIYACKDGHHMAVACIEPQFYERFCQTLRLEGNPVFAHQMDSAQWPKMKSALENIFLEQTRDEWTTLFENVDCCVTPVLLMSEVPNTAQMKARDNFVVQDGYAMPRPATRFSRTPAQLGKLSEVGADTKAIFKEFGL